MSGPPHISPDKRRSLNIVAAILVTGYVLAWIAALVVIGLYGKT